MFKYKTSLLRAKECFMCTEVQLCSISSNLKSTPQLDEDFNLENIDEISRKTQEVLTQFQKELHSLVIKKTAFYVTSGSICFLPIIGSLIWISPDQFYRTIQTISLISSTLFLACSCSCCAKESYYYSEWLTRISQFNDGFTAFVKNPNDITITQVFNQFNKAAFHFSSHAFPMTNLSLALTLREVYMENLNNDNFLNLNHNFWHILNLPKPSREDYQKVKQSKILHSPNVIANFFIKTLLKESETTYISRCINGISCSKDEEIVAVTKENSYGTF